MLNTYIIPPQSFALLSNCWRRLEKKTKPKQIKTNKQTKKAALSSFFSYNIMSYWRIKEKNTGVLCHYHERILILRRNLLESTLLRCSKVIVVGFQFTDLLLTYFLKMPFESLLRFQSFGNQLSPFSAKL